MSTELPPATRTPGENAEQRRRPPGRREAIIDAAAAAFAASGFHSTRLNAIAAEVGVSTPALYRHFPNKSDLFAQTSRHLADAVRDAVDQVPDIPGDDIGTVRGVLSALVEVSLAHRSGGIYRWQAQYLAAPDAAYVREVVVAQHRRIRSLITEIRSGWDAAALTRTQADVLAAACVSAAGSPATHRATLPGRQAATLITDAALAMIGVDAAAVDVHTPPPPGLSPASKRERILFEALPLFAARGFREVTIEEIAARADMPPSGVYRHYDNKAAILEAAFWRANDRVIAAIDDALAAARSPADAVCRLVDHYVGLCSENAELVGIYTGEIGNVEIRAQSALRKQQRRNVDEWAGWLSQARDLPSGQARFLVHAALNVANDLTRNQQLPQALVRAALHRFLLGDHATSDPAA